MDPFELECKVVTAVSLAIQARTIVKEIPGKVAQATLRDKNSVNVMRIPVSEIDVPTAATRPIVYSHLWLRGVSKLVFDFCVEAKLNPAIDYNSAEGIHIDISWENL